MGKEEVRIGECGMRIADLGEQWGKRRKLKLEIRFRTRDFRLRTLRRDLPSSNYRHGDQDAVDKLSGIANCEIRKAERLFNF